MADVSDRAWPTWSPTGSSAVISALEQTGLKEVEMSHALEHDSGLQGLAGSGDMREVLRRRGDGDARAREDLEMARQARDLPSPG